MNKKDIDLINNYLKEGKTIEEIRSNFLMDSKLFEYNILASGYEYNNSLNQYTRIDYSNRFKNNIDILKDINNEALNRIRNNSLNIKTSNTNSSIKNNTESKKENKRISIKEEDIKIINNYLREGKKVTEIRSIIGLGEKSFQEQIRELEYKYNQKLKQYIKIGLDDNSNTKSSTECNTEVATTKSNTLCNTEDRSLLFIRDNIDLLEEMLMNYKHHKECSMNNYGIIIDLIDDKHIKENDNPKSIRVNYFVWEEWIKFTEGTKFSKKELISMALKEYMKKYKK